MEQAERCGVCPGSNPVLRELCDCGFEMLYLKGQCHEIFDTIPLIELSRKRPLVFLMGYFHDLEKIIKICFYRFLTKFSAFRVHMKILK
jgi:hypothetical protein